MLLFVIFFCILNLNFDIEFKLHFESVQAESVVKGISHPTESEKIKNQLEELYIWKMNDELKLTPSEEKKLTDVIKKVNFRKHEINAKIEKITSDLINSKSEKDKIKRLNDLKNLYSKHGKINSEELDTVKAAIGINKLARYLEIKKELSEKVKSLLIPNDKKPKKTLPPPKIIEEK